MKIKRFLYKRGLRPKPGSIFFSPSLAMQYAWKDIDFPKILKQAIDEFQTKENNKEQ